MRNLLHRLLCGVILTVIPLSANAANDCTMTAGTVLRWTSNYEHIEGELIEEVVGRDGLLSIHAAQRSQGDSDPELSLDILYGGIYVGDVNALIDVPFTIVSTAEFDRFLDVTPDFFNQIRMLLYTGNHIEQMDAIAKAHESPTPGLEIDYRFTRLFSETIRVQEPESIELGFADDKTISAVRLDIDRHYRNGEITTTRYWFTPDMRLLVRYWNNAGKTPHEENLVSCIQR